MIRLHTAGTPNGQKVSILLEELGVDYEVRAVVLGEGEQRTPEFLALNPYGKIPVLEDGDLVVWDSGAILLHLAERFGRFLPADPAGRIHAVQFLFFQSSAVAPNQGRLGAQWRRPEEERNAEMVDLFSEEMKRVCDTLGRVLADGREYLVGEYSIADIAHYPWLARLVERRFAPMLEQSRVVAWLERIGGRPAVERGMKVP